MLMIVIISSFDDYLSEGIGTEEIRIWNRIKQNILKDDKLHTTTLYTIRQEFTPEERFSCSIQTQ